MPHMNAYVGIIYLSYICIDIILSLVLYHHLTFLNALLNGYMQF